MSATVPLGTVGAQVFTHHLPSRSNPSSSVKMEHEEHPNVNTGVTSNTDNTEQPTRALNACPGRQETTVLQIRGELKHQTGLLQIHLATPEYARPPKRRRLPPSFALLRGTAQPAALHTAALNERLRLTWEHSASPAMLGRNPAVHA